MMKPTFKCRKQMQQKKPPHLSAIARALNLTSSEEGSGKGSNEQGISITSKNIEYTKNKATIWTRTRAFKNYNPHWFGNLPM